MNNELEIDENSQLAPPAFRPQVSRSVSEQLIRYNFYNYFWALDSYYADLLLSAAVAIECLIRLPTFLPKYFTKDKELTQLKNNFSISLYHNYSIVASQDNSPIKVRIITQF